MKLKLFLTCYFILMALTHAFAQSTPVKIGVAGLTHGHVHGLLGRETRGDIEITGIAEANRELAQQYAQQYGFSMDMVYSTLEALIEATQPEAVAAFGNIYRHLEVVETCAPRGVHVMVEKPLAVNMEHAQKMAALAKAHDIHLLTNYETTWYPSNHKAYDLLKSGKIGDLRKIIVRDGHKGPKRIGVSSEFLNWLIDPKLNGGGALMDFGCYGANLVTWLMEGQRPNSVTAVTQQLQPENNPRVADDAMVILKYDQANAIIQASWNWPIGIKDMRLYGLDGAIFADNKTDLRVRLSTGYSDYNKKAYTLEPRNAPYDDPFAFLAAVVRGKIEVKPYDLSSLANNMRVMEILDAAQRSAETGKTISIEK